MPLSSRSRKTRRRTPASRRRGYALIVALALLALGMGTAVVMLRTSDLSVRASTRDDLQKRADGAALSAVELGIDVIRRRAWPGVNYEFSGSWLDGASFRVKYLAGDAALTSSSTDYAYYPYRVTIQATATVVDPSDSTATSNSVATAVLELVPQKLQGTLSGYGDRNDYAYYQIDRFNSNGEVRLEPPFQFVGKTRLSDPITAWCPDYFSTSSLRQDYFAGLKTMAASGTERRPFVGNVEYKFSEQPGTLRADLVTHLGITEVDVSPTLEWAMPTASSSKYQLYPGGPEYAIPSFNSTYGSTPQNLTASADPTTNPLGLMKVSSSLTFNGNVSIGGMLMAGGSSVSLTVAGPNCKIESPKAMNLNSRTLGLALPCLCVSDDVTIEAAADDVSLRGGVVCWDKFTIENGTSAQDVSIEGGLQSHGLWIKGRYDFASFASWNTATTQWNAAGRTPVLPLYVETNYGLPSEPSIKIKKDVTGATAKHVFNPSQPLYDYPDSTSGLAWRVVRLTPPT